MRPLLFAVVFVLIAGLGYLALNQDGKSPAGNLENQQSSEVEQSLADANADLEGPKIEENGVSSELPIEERKVLPKENPVAEAPKEELVFANQDPDGVVVHVQVLETKKPASGAHVRVLNAEVLFQNKIREMMTAGMGLDQVIAELGTLYKADEYGNVRIALSGDGAAFGAQWASDGVEYRGSLIVEENVSPPYTISLAPPSGFEVSVVDPAGNGIPKAEVQLLFGSKRVDTPSEGRYDLRAMGSATTNASGVAQLPNALLEFSRSGGAEQMADVAAFVGVTGVFSSRKCIAVEWQDATPQKVKLEIPFTGRVELELDRDKAQLNKDGHVLLGIKSEGGTPGTGLLDGASGMGASPADQAKAIRANFGPKDSKVEFPLVELGLDLVAQGVGRGGELGKNISFPGPGTKGEVVKRVLPFAAKGMSVRFRLTMPDGKPLVKQRVAFKPVTKYWYQSENLINLETTGGDGFIEFSTLHLAQQEDFQGEFRVSTGQNAEMLMAQGKLEMPLETGKQELGTLVLSAPPIIVSGRVVDTSGKGVACGIWVRQDTVLEAHLSGEEGADTYEEPVHPPGSWRIRSDGTGAFELRGIAAPIPLMLTINTKHLVLADRAVEAQPGTTNLILEVQQAARLQLSVHAPKLPSDTVLSLGLHREGAGAHEMDWGMGNLDSIQTPFVSAGTYSAMVCIGQDALNPLWVAQVELNPGETLDRGKVSLDREIFQYEIVPVLPQGKVLEDYYIGKRYTQGEEAPMGHVQTLRDRYRLLSAVPIDTIHIMAVSGKQRPQPFSIVSGRNQIRLD